MHSANYNIDGLVQERHNSSALAMELCLSCTNPSILHVIYQSSFNLTIYRWRSARRVTLMLMHWSYHSLALSYRDDSKYVFDDHHNDFICFDDNCSDLKMFLMI